MRNSLKTTQAILLTLAILSPALVLAQAPPNLNPQTLPSTGISSFGQLLGKVCQLLNYVFAVLILIAIIFVFVAAFRYLTAGGDPEKVGGANRTLIYAAVAIAVGLLAKAIPLIVGSLLGVQTGFFSC